MRIANSISKAVSTKNKPIVFERKNVLPISFCRFSCERIYFHFAFSSFICKHTRNDNDDNNNSINSLYYSLLPLYAARENYSVVSDTHKHTNINAYVNNLKEEKGKDGKVNQESETNSQLSQQLLLLYKKPYESPPRYHLIGHLVHKSITNGEREREKERENQQ